MTFNLEKIPGVLAPNERVWNVRALSINCKCEVSTMLLNWSRQRPLDFKAIIKVLNLAAQQYRVKNPHHVKKSADPAHGEAYEAIAFQRVARVMFFYDDRPGRSYLICTVPHEKQRGDQSKAFLRCAQLRDLYLANT